MQAKINALEIERQKDDQYRNDLEKLIDNLEKSKGSQMQETNIYIIQNKELKIDLEQTMNSKSKISDELDTATEYVISMEEKVFKSNKISLELLKQLKETEA